MALLARRLAPQRTAGEPALICVRSALTSIARPFGRPVHAALPSCEGIPSAEGQLHDQAENIPLVSVCIPTHNDGNVLRDAVASALKQRYARLEILIVDNASADNTQELVRDAMAVDNRVQYFRHPENIGMAGNFNACLDLAQGELVLILCADDMLEADAVAVMAAALQAHPDASLAAGARLFVDPQLHLLGRSRVRVRAQTVGGGPLARTCFARGNVIGEPSAVMFRRRFVQAPFDPAYSQLLDLAMWLHLLQRGTAVLLPDYLCRIRRHSGQTTQANLRSGRIVEDKRRLFRQFLPTLSPPLSALEKLAWDLRMASSVARVRAAGHRMDATNLSEVFFPIVFTRVLAPLAQLAWAVLHAWRGGTARGA